MAGPIGRLISACAIHLTLRLFRVGEVDGFTVSGLVGNEADEPLAFSRLQAALALVRYYEPRRYARLKNDCLRFLFTPFDGAEYFPDCRTCVLGRSVVFQSPDRLAIAIVHEGTHARISAFGVRSAGVRERVERACVRAECAFATRLPDGAQLAAEAAEKLAHPWWTTETLLARRAKELDQLGWPRWLQRACKLWRNP
jgi:hypothetical protein